MTGTSAQFPKQMGDTAIEAAYQLLNEKTIPKTKEISVEMITKANISQLILTAGRGGEEDRFQE